MKHLQWIVFQIKRMHTDYINSIQLNTKSIKTLMKEKSKVKKKLQALQTVARTLTIWWLLAHLLESHISPRPLQSPHNHKANSYLKIIIITHKTAALLVIRIHLLKASNTIEGLNLIKMFSHIGNLFWSVMKPLQRCLPFSANFSHRQKRESSL